MRMFPESTPQPSSNTSHEKKRIAADPEKMGNNDLLEFRKALKWHLQNISPGDAYYLEELQVVERIVTARGLTLH